MNQTHGGSMADDRHRSFSTNVGISATRNSTYIGNSSNSNSIQINTNSNPKFPTMGMNNTLTEQLNGISLTSTVDNDAQATEVQSQRNGSLDNHNTTTSSESSSLPITYRVAWGKTSNAFTITLVVPKQNNNNNNQGQDQGQGTDASKPIFQKLEPNSAENLNNTNGEETHVLRIPLSYFVNLSNQSSSEDFDSSTSWLDRSTLRARLRDGGSAVGLESHHIYQAVAAVEESAIRMADWVPHGSESINAAILISDGSVSIAACVPSQAVPNTNTNNSNNKALANSHCLSSSFEARNDSDLVATAPSFPSLNINNGGDSSLSQQNGNGNGPSFSSTSGFLSDHNINNIRESSASASSISISNGLFSSPNAKGSSLSTSPMSMYTSNASSDPWNINFNTSNNSNLQHNRNNRNENNRQQFANDQFHGRSSQEPSHNYMNTQDRNMNMSMNMNMNIENNRSHNPYGIFSDGGPVNANQLFSSSMMGPPSTQPINDMMNNMNMNVNISANNNSNHNHNHNRNNKRNDIVLSMDQQSRPDPSSIVKPMLLMGFTRMECDAAVNAIKNLAMSNMREQSQQQQQQNMSHPNSPMQLQPLMHRMPGERQRHRSFSSASSGSSNGFVNNNDHNHNQNDHNKGMSISEAQLMMSSHDNQQRQISGEDILGYVLNNSKGGNINAFETKNRSSSSRILGGDGHGHGHSHHIDQIHTVHEHHAGGANVWDQMSMSGSTSSDEQQRSLSSVGSSNGPVWGNAGKLKVVKSEGNTMAWPESPVQSSHQQQQHELSNSNQVSESHWNNNDASSPQKMMKVLNIPPEMNAFVFHCNSHTREECLERGLFGCPSGGQYGPHSKAKKGDLLFLADFSAWTVTGIFTAKSDAGLNYEKNAWNGRFPWQIKVEPWNDLRTVHIDKVNEIIGLASGSKLNMLTKDQLLSLVTSREFGPCVPSHLFKLKPMSQPQVPKTVLDVPTLRRESAPQTMNSSGKSSLGSRGIKYNRAPASIGTNDEHPATAMHRLKLITSWFDSIANQVLIMNEVYNNKKVSPKKDGEKSKAVLDDKIIAAIKSCASSGQTWPLMSFSYVRSAVADIFDQWLFFAHATENGPGKNNNNNAEKLANSWTKQGRSSSSNGKAKEDVVLLLRIPGATAYVKALLLNETGASALAVPDEIADILASRFILDVENISIEVRKTQVSLMKIGGENYIKSISDKTLGMKLNENISKRLMYEDDIDDTAVVRIEWHTKSSIAQGRPPQVQKIYKTHYDALRRTYMNLTDEDPDMTHFLSRLFVLLCRYDLIGDVTSRCQAVIPTMASSAMVEHFGISHECFSSPLDLSCNSFNSTIFSDIDKYFGSLGSFFEFSPFAGSFKVNPPFGGHSLSLMCDHIFALLEKSKGDSNALSFLVIIKDASNSFARHVKSSPYCRRLVSLDSSFNYRANTQHKDTVSASRKQPKKSSAVEDSWPPSVSISLIWLQNDSGYDLWTPSNEKVGQVLQGFHAHNTNSNAVFSA